MVAEKSSSCGSMETPKGIRSKLLKYDSFANDRKIEEYEYDTVDADRKVIRLLRLLPGVRENPQIDCEMFQGEFDQFGILREIDPKYYPADPKKEEDGRADHSSNACTPSRSNVHHSNPTQADGAPTTPEGAEDGSNVTPAKENRGFQQTSGSSDKQAAGEDRAEAVTTSAEKKKGKKKRKRKNKKTTGEKETDKTTSGEEGNEKTVSEKEGNDKRASREGDNDKRTNEEEESDKKKGAEEVSDKRKGAEGESDKKPAQKIIEYEALSWRWGNEDEGPYTIMIKENGRLFKKRVSRTLGLALKYLRKSEDRILWVDAICIDQQDLEERSYQVSMMSLVYTGSKKVCVWLGEDDDDSQLAIQFIKEEISKLKNFDRLSTDKENANKWRALLALMQRDWFSRRWVVQEIALATKATVYCGPDKIPWRDLAIAVELFVEVETATHRLSELMKKDEKSAVVPYWFEHISELGASVLMNATAMIFRGEHRRGGYGANTITPPEAAPLRRSLLSLEYLVTSLSTFDCGRPHDSVYSLIAIARDAAPHPPSSITKRTDEALVAEVFSDALEQKPYPLDYSSSYPDVCKEFIQFCIMRCNKSDPGQALDILCRPWAKDWRPGEYTAVVQEYEPEPETLIKHTGGWFRIPDMWIDDQQGNLVRNPETWLAKEGKMKSGLPQKLDTRDMETYWREANEKHPPEPKFMEDWFQVIEKAQSSADPQDEKSKRQKATKKQNEFAHVKPESQSKKNKKRKNVDAESDPKRIKSKAKDLLLPSWVATISGAPFDIFLHPGMDMVKMGRKNADPLVSAPQDGHRNYNAGQSRNCDFKTLKFCKRARLGHYSLYVKGFRFDKVKEVAQVSQSGAIPASWLDLADWSKARRSRDDPGDPPNEFWRTLVADRGMNDRNPPYYYMRACKETIKKGGLRSNAVDTSALIHNERNSIIAEFCRRVQAVIWNRALIKTESGALGLVSEDVRVGDWICIIYGCTVPVILRKEGWKTTEELEGEEFEDRIELAAKCMRNAAKRRARKARYLHHCATNKNDKGRKWEEVAKEELEEHEKKRQEEKEKDTAFEKRRKELWPPKSITEATGGTEEGPPNDDTDEEKNDDELGGTDQQKIKREKVRQEKTSKKDRYRHFSFKGEAYIHGMMDGEAVRQKFYKAKPDHIFEIR